MTALEIDIQNSILGELGCAPGVMLLRNAIDHRGAQYGLGMGSPDLVGWLAPFGRVVGLEVKRPGEKPTEQQLKVHAQWRKRGAYVRVVRSVPEAWIAMARACEMSASKDAWAYWGDEPDEVPNGFVVFDTETTGLAKDARIVEIAAAKVVGGRVVDTFETLCNPESEIPREASAIHGIHTAHVKTAPMVAEALESFRQFCGLFPLIAHNASYDVRMLRSEARRTHALLPFVPTLCSIKIAKKMVVGLKSYSLDSLIDRYSVKRKTAHRALPDVLALVEVLRHLAREKPGVSLRDAHGPAEVLCDLTEGSLAWAP